MATNITLSNPNVSLGAATGACLKGCYEGAYIALFVSNGNGKTTLNLYGFDKVDQDTVDAFLIHVGREGMSQIHNFDKLYSVEILEACETMLPHFTTLINMMLIVGTRTGQEVVKIHNKLKQEDIDNIGKVLKCQNCTEEFWEHFAASGWKCLHNIIEL